MSSTKQAVNIAFEDLKTLVRDAEKVLAEAGEDAGEHVAELRERMRAALKNSRSHLEDIRENAREQMDRCDEYVRGHPYQSIGTAVALGAILGLLLGRKLS